MLYHLNRPFQHLLCNLSLCTYYEVSLIVIDMYFPIGHAKKKDLAVWRPCHMSKLISLELLSPNSVSYGETKAFVPLYMSVLIPSVCEQSNPCQGSLDDFMLVIFTWLYCTWLYCKLLEKHYKSVITIYRSNNDCSIFIHNADLLPISIPTHTPYDRLVPIVNHLLVPGTFRRVKTKNYESRTYYKTTSIFSLTTLITFV